MEAAAIEGLTTEYQTLYSRHLNTLRTRITTGRLKIVYHFLLAEGYSEEKMRQIIDILKAKHVTGCKLNIAFGLFLRNIETGQLRFFHPSNNVTLFDIPKLLKSNEDFTNLLDDLEVDDVLAYATTHRPSTKWAVDRIVCVRFDVYKIR